MSSSTVAQAEATHRPGVPALVTGAVLVAGGLAFLGPALKWPLPFVSVELQNRGAALAFAGLGVVSLGLALRSIVRTLQGSALTTAELSARWRRSRRYAPVAAALALAAFAVPLLDGLIADYQVVRGGWLFWTSGAVWLLAAASLSWNPEKVIRHQELEEGTALHGVATIEDFEDTGWTINENPRVRLKLRIDVAGREPYVIEHTAVVSRLAVGRLRIGERLPVLVHPEQPEVARLLWKESVPE